MERELMSKSDALYCDFAPIISLGFTFSIFKMGVRMSIPH